MRTPRLVPCLLVLAIVTAASPAFADVTLFVGNTSTPSNRAARGFAAGVGFLIVGFEFEYSNTGDEPDEAAPGLRTGMGNLMLQTPFALAGLQPYFTTGGGIYRETLGDRQETQFGLNSGAGVKVSLVGPLRARFDYRVFKLRGDPLHDVVHRVYAGVNLKF